MGLLLLCVNGKDQHTKGVCVESHRRQMSKRAKGVQFIVHMNKIREI
jgi:hypothetical protein